MINKIKCWVGFHDWEKIIFIEGVVVKPAYVTYKPILLGRITCKICHKEVYKKYESN